MKTLKYLIIASFILSLGSCELDNYSKPNAQIYGSILDQDTEELVPQDLENGSEIEMQEHGYDENNPERRFMNMKVDGTYRDNYYFAGTYTMITNNCNFVPLDTNKNVVIKEGENKIDLMVQPYIRVKNIDIQKIGDDIVANFTLEQTVSDPIKSISLFGSIDYFVGTYFRLATVTEDLNRIVTADETFTIILHLRDYDADPERNFKPGKQYYFRIGARIDIPGAKHNFATAIRITC